MLGHFSEIIVLSDTCVIDLKHGDVVKGGLRISLSKRGALLTGALAKRLGHPVPYDVLIDEVWGQEGISRRNSLYQCVLQVRTIIEDEVHRPGYLLPVKGFGYMLVSSTSRNQ